MPSLVPSLVPSIPPTMAAPIKINRIKHLLSHNKGYSGALLEQTNSFLNSRTGQACYYYSFYQHGVNAMLEGRKEVKIASKPDPTISPPNLPVEVGYVSGGGGGDLGGGIESVAG